jgi:RNA polymerase sigma-70 factor (ECF subfamily)
VDGKKWRVMTENDGRELPLDSARSGDPAAITEFYEHFGDTVYRVAYRLLGSSADAEDVVQDVFLGLPEALKTFAARGSLEGWLKRVTTRTALMMLRKQRIRRESSLDEMSEIPGATNPGNPVDRVALERALKKLPLKLRSAFVLKEVEGYTHAEIGEILGISVTASKIQLYRARKRLRQDLEVVP